MDKRSATEKKQQEDIALTRALICFAAAMVLEALILLADRYYVNFRADSAAIALALAIDKVIHVLAVAATAAGAGLAVWYGLRAARGGKPPFLTLVGGVSLLILGLGSAAIVLLRTAAAPVRALSVLVPALAVLVLIYYLYQKDFFLSALAAALGLFALWMLRQNAAAHRVIFFGYAAAALLLLAGIVWVTLRARAGGGTLTLGERSIPVLPKQGGSPALILATCALSLVCAAAGTVLGASAAFYLMVALGAWAFILLVYYTVKMM